MRAAQCRDSLTLHPQSIAGDIVVSGRTHDQGQGVETRVGDQSPVTEEEGRIHPVSEVGPKTVLKRVVPFLGDVSHLERLQITVADLACHPYK